MRTSYCKQKNVVTIKLERQEFEDLKYETERDDTNMVWNIIEACDNVIERPERYDIGHLSDILDEEEVQYARSEEEEPFVAQSMRDFSALIRPTSI